MSISGIELTMTGTCFTVVMSRGDLWEKSDIRSRVNVVKLYGGEESWMWSRFL